MSNPERDVEKSAWYHRFPIWGIVAVIVLAALAFLIFVPMGEEVAETPVDEVSTESETPDAAITTDTPDPPATTAD